jgi:hypothetical protein
MGFFDIFGSNRRNSEDKNRKQRQEISISPFPTIEGKVISAFTRVKQDITLLSSWVKYLRHKDLLGEERHAKAQRELGVHKTLIDGLKQDTAELKNSVRELREELKLARQAQNDARISAAERENRFVSELNTDLIRTKSELNPDRKRTNFENKVVSMLRSRKKDYVLKQILELARSETHSTREIEEIIVGEKALCGRTAFYDYLRELKHKSMIRHGEKGEKKIILLK